MNMETVLAGLLHDYLERGGKYKDLINFSDEVKLIVKLLTKQDDFEVPTSGTNGPLEEIKRLLPTIKEPELRNNLILIKIADRLDNLKKRKKQNADGKIERNYLLKSNELITFLVKSYTGDQSKLDAVMDYMKAKLIKWQQK